MVGDLGSLEWRGRSSIRLNSPEVSHVGKMRSSHAAAEVAYKPPGTAMADHYGN
jgi:hypothetical protein